MKAVVKNGTVKITLTVDQLQAIFAALDLCIESEACPYSDVKGVYIKLAWAFHRARNGGEL